MHNEKARTEETKGESTQRIGEKEKILDRFSRCLIFDVSDRSNPTTSVTLAPSSTALGLIGALVTPNGFIFVVIVKHTRINMSSHCRYLIHGEINSNFFF